MAEDKIEQELVEIKKLLKRSQRRAEVQWVYTVGFTGVMGSLALLAIKAASWAVLLVFFAGFILMMIAPYLVKKES